MARFVHKGKPFVLEREDVVRAMKGKDPGSVRKYAVAVHGKEFPIKQVISETLHLNVADFTAHDAYRWLQKTGFPIEVYD